MFRFLESSKFAIEGILFGLRTERNVQIWFGVLILNLVLSYWLEISKFEFMFILGSTLAIGIAEYLNTAIEALSDRVTLERDEQIKRVKDLAAGATFLASILAFTISCLIFIPKLIEKFEISL
ncbi:MAG: diacylglycerol kinase [Weeksellaceae bacterium]